MMLRIKVPQPMFLFALYEEVLNDVSVIFTYRHYSVTLTISGGTPTKASWAKPESSCQWYRETTEIVTVIAETEKSSHRIADLIVTSHHDELLKLLEGLTLQALRVIRNVGIAPELPETLPRKESLEEELRDWGPEVSEDSTNWRSIFPPEGARARIKRGLLGFGGPRKEGFAKNAELNVSYWYHVKEILQDNLEIPPEDEFLTNTTGHLRGRNYRLAVVDAVIGLEIVLNRYLKAYLAVTKGIPKKRIDDFLRHDFGLTARLSGILDLTVHESWMKDFDLDQVLRAVDWRNGIVHRKGRLPEGIPTDAIVNAVNAVLKLARTLAELTTNEIAQVDRNKICEAIMKNWGDRINGPRIWLKPWHRVHAEINHYGDPFSRDDLKKISEELVGHLKVRDARFNHVTDLQVMYYNGYPKEYYGQYWLGSVFLKGESPLEVPPKKTLDESATVDSTPGNSTQPSASETPTHPSLP